MYCFGLPLLLIFTLSGVSADFNITLVRFPINVTAVQLSLKELFSRNSLRALATRIVTAANNTLAYVTNGSIGCSGMGEKCIPGFSSCCPLHGDDEDLQCLRQNGIYRCVRLNDSEDQAQMRINALEYGDSMGVLESHPWVDSWEFQSQSEAEREELQALEEAEWKKNWKPNDEMNFWLKTYNKVKAEGKKMWNDMRKLKKLKEVKEFLTDKRRKRVKATNSPVIKENKEPSPDDRVSYPDLISKEKEPVRQEPVESENSVIKFSDEVPKRDKALDFRIDDIIKDAFSKSKTGDNKKRKGKHPLISSSASDEEILDLNDIHETEDTLMKELEELKQRKKQQEMENEARQCNSVERDRGPDIDELIKKHVAAILEEERKLDKALRIEKLKRLEKNGKI